MANNSEFKLFNAGPYYNLGLIYAVVTGEKNEKTNHIETEWFYYVTHCHKNVGRKISLDSSDTIEQFWENYTIEDLRNSIYCDEIVPVLKEIKDFLFYPKVELQEMKNEKISYLSIENMEFINYLKEYSKCTDLKKIVDVLPIIKIEKKEIK
jgi:hypothetical protein